MPPSLDVAAVRRRFPALSRTVDGRPCVYADAPGGTQVPASVAEAMSGYLLRSNANQGGAFVTSEETTALIEDARVAAADLLGGSPDEMVFGPNMTSLAFTVARSLGRTLGPGDEVVVTRLDHDANVAPWILAAEDAGATVRWVDIREEDCTLDLESLEEVLGPRTRIVAFTLASNAVGTVTPAQEIVRRVRQTKAIVVADAVHVAQHRLIDVRAIGADVLFCSPYKIFGPHLGIMFLRGDLLESLRPSRVRPAPETGPGRWETGTQNHEGLAGLVAAVDYLGGIAGIPEADRRAAIAVGMDSIASHEAELTRRFLDGIGEIEGARLYGIAETSRVGERTPTFAIRLGDLAPRQAAEELGKRGIFVWDGNYYALAIMERLGLEGSGGALRVGFCHYSTTEEVDRVLDELAALRSG